MHKPLTRQNRFDAGRQTTGMLELGVCYYPEQWPREKWDEDARRMVDLGLAWVRTRNADNSTLGNPRPMASSFAWVRALSSVTTLVFPPNV